MMVHLAMSGLPDWTAGEELKRFAYVHLAPDLDMMARAYSEAMAGLLPAEPVLVVGQPTAIDPSRAPEGKHILWVQVRVLPAEIRGDAAGDDRRARLGCGEGGLCRPRRRHHRALRAGHAGEDPGAPRRVSRRPRTPQPEPRRRRQSRRQPPPVAELPLPPGAGLGALADAGPRPLPDRRIDLAGRGNGRGLGLHAGEDAGALNARSAADQRVRLTRDPANL